MRDPVKQKVRDENCRPCRACGRFGPRGVACPCGCRDKVLSRPPGGPAQPVDCPRRRERLRRYEELAARSLPLFSEGGDS